MMDLYQFPTIAIKHYKQNLIHEKRLKKKNVPKECITDIN
jgi:hypothetical protein